MTTAPTPPLSAASSNPLISQFREWRHAARGYALDDARADVAAGLTVAVMGIPQAMAYAMLVGVPPIYGLYTAVISCILGAAFGSSRHLITGPTNATCIVLFSIASPYIAEGRNAIEIILLLSFLAGVVKLAFGLLRLGGIVRYISNSVVVGLTAGAGVLIIANQLKNFLGFQQFTPQASHIFAILEETVRRFPQANWYAAGLAVLTMLIVVLLRQIDRRIPGPLLGVAVCTGLVYFLGWNNAPHHVSILRDLTVANVSGTPNLFPLHIPEYLRYDSFDFELFRRVSTGVVAVALLGLVEAVSSARAAAAQSNQQVDYSREFVGQGIANIAGSFCLNFASSGSFTRTALCLQSGGRTRVAAIFSALFTALAIVVAAPLIQWVPQASLAGMLVVIAISMMEGRRFQLAFKSGGNSRVVLFTTLIACLVVPLHTAIFIGIFVSILFLLQITGKPDLTLLVPRPGGRFDEIPFNQATAPEPIVLVNIEGDLYFAAAEQMGIELQQALTPKTRVVILRMKRMRAVGSSAIAILEHFWNLLRERDIILALSGVERKLAGVFVASGLREKIGEANIFYADNTIFQSTELALARARSIIEMERVRAAAAQPGSASGMLQIRNLMNRQCIRFGDNHSVREAIWLSSEMNARVKNHALQPLFLQDREGKLAAELDPMRLLHQILNEEENLAALTDAQVSEKLNAAFQGRTRDYARILQTHLSPDASFALALREWIQSGFASAAVCDHNGRLTGMFGAEEALMGLGKLLQMAAPETQPSEPAATPPDDEKL